MGLTRLAIAIALVGVALIVAGTTVLFGPWALVASGVVLVVLGAGLDLEKVT